MSWVCVSTSHNGRMYYFTFDSHFEAELFVLLVMFDDDIKYISMARYK